jgi:hypothetical protein
VSTGAVAAGCNAHEVCTPAAVRASRCFVHAPSAAPTSACRATPVAAWSTAPAPSANTPGLPRTHTVFVASIASATGFALKSCRCVTGAKTRAKSGTASAGTVTVGCDASSSARVCTGGEGVEGREACGGGGASATDVRYGSAGRGCGRGRGIRGVGERGVGAVQDEAGERRGGAEQSHELWDRQLRHMGV